MYAMSQQRNSLNLTKRKDHVAVLVSTAHVYFSKANCYTFGRQLTNCRPSDTIDMQECRHC